MFYPIFFLSLGKEFPQTVLRGYQLWSEMERKALN